MYSTLLQLHVIPIIIVRNKESYLLNIPITFFSSTVVRITESPIIFLIFRTRHKHHLNGYGGGMLEIY